MADQPLVIETKTSVLDELEKLAEGFEQRNFHFVSLCLTKIVRAVAPPSSLASEQTIGEEAVSTGGLAELHKAVKALDAKEFHLAGLCFRKALSAYNAAPPTLAGVTILDAGALKGVLAEIEHALSEGQSSSVAGHIRRLAALIQIPEHARQFVTEQEPGTSLEGGPEAEVIVAVEITQLASGAPSSGVTVAAPESGGASQAGLSQEERIANLHDRLGKLEQAWEATHAELQATRAELHQLRAAASGSDIFLPERSDIPPIV